MLEKRKKPYESLGVEPSPQVGRRPSLGNVRGLLQKAVDHFGEMVELVWQDGEPPDQYSLTCISGRRPSDEAPLWSLHKGKGSTSQSLWAYESSDLALIYNILICSFADTAMAHNTSAHSAEESLTGQHEKEKGHNASSAKHNREEPAEIDSESREDVAHTLTGSLEKFRVDTLLQSISVSGLTGQLHLKTKVASGIIFFENGIPIHCRCAQQEGHNAILELLTWTKGTFYFIEGSAGPKRTITRRLESLLLEGAALKDYSDSFSQLGVTSDTYLIAPEVTNQQYVEMLKGSVPVNEAVQRSLFTYMDGKFTLEAIIEMHSLARAEWTPIVYNLLKSGLARPAGSASKRNQPNIEPVTIDPLVVDLVNDQLNRPDTGLLSFPAFLYFLGIEHARFEAYRRPFSIMLMRLAKREAKDEASPLMGTALTEAIDRLRKIIRKTDLFCHYEELDYAFILPETSIGNTRSLIRRILDSLAESPLSSEVSKQNLIIATGASNMPSDCENPGVMLAIALRARDESFNDLL